MALTLTTALPSLLFSCDIPNLKFAGTDPSYTFTLRASGVTLLEVKVYAYNGSLTIYDLRSVIEEYMRDNSLPFSVFTMISMPSVGDTPNITFNFSVIFSSMVMPIDIEAFVGNNFLTTAKWKRLTDNTVQLSAYAAQGEDITPIFQIWSASPAGPVYQSYRGDSATANSSSVYNFSVSLTECAAHCEIDASAILAISFSVGSRSVIFHSGYTDYDIGFAFRNNFNVIEEIFCRAETVSKLNVERSLAVTDRNSSFYNQSVTMLHEAQTETLTIDEGRWLEQLFASHDVRAMSKGRAWLELPQILITEITSEVSDSALSVAKFTWRYADNRPHIQDSFNDGNGTFTNQFTQQFN